MREAEPDVACPERQAEARPQQGQGQLSRLALAVASPLLVAAAVLLFPRSSSAFWRRASPAEEARRRGWVDRWPLAMLQEKAEEEDMLSAAEASQQCPLFMKQAKDPCCWTRAWSCPTQPLGNKGSAVNDGTLSFHCCCKEEFWRRAKACPKDEKLSAAQRAAVRAEEEAASERAAPSVSCNSSGPQQHQDPEDMPQLCQVGVEMYAYSPKVQALCKQQKKWEKLSKEVQREPCIVNPVTKMMTCRRNFTCSGGARSRQNALYLSKTLTYDCGETCKGSLLINCCNTCQEAQRDPDSMGVNVIACEGCETSKLQDAAQEANCQMFNGAFKCGTHATCSTGDPSQTCHEQHNDCDVYPCGACEHPQLKAQCCVDCLEKMCSATEPERRMMCDGCEGPPEENAAGWKFWR